MTDSPSDQNGDTPSEPKSEAVAAANAGADASAFDEFLERRHKVGRIFELVCGVATWIGLVVLFVFLLGLIFRGWSELDWHFLSSSDSSFPEEAGMAGGIWGSVWLVLCTALVSVPVGIGAAVYLEEYASDSWIRRVIQTNISNLAGVPSIVYGMLGLTVFYRAFGLFGDGFSIWPLGAFGVADVKIDVPLGGVILTGALTLGLLILPVIIVASQEALRAVPPSIRHASLALGATRWQTIRHQVLPASIPGIMTGVILALSRAIGETAPIILVGAASFLLAMPGGIGSPADVIGNPLALLQIPFEPYTCMPLQIFNWVKEPRAEFKDIAAAAILVMLMILIAMNGVAVYLRNRYQIKQW